MNPKYLNVKSKMHEWTVKVKNEKSDVFKAMQITNSMQAFIMIILISLAYYLFGILIKTNSSDIESFDKYILVAWLASVLPIFTSYFFNGNNVIALSVSFLIAIGFTMQSMCGNASSTAKFIAWSLIASVGVVFIYEKFCNKEFLEKNTKKIIIFTIFSSITLIAVLVLFAKELNGVKAWIIIGGSAESEHSIQITELFKLTQMLAFAVIFNSNISEKKKIVIGTAVLSGYSLIYLYSGEMGSLLIFMAVYSLLTLIFIKDRLLLFKYFLIIFFLLAVGVGIIYLFSEFDAKNSFVNHLHVISSRIVMRYKIHIDPTNEAMGYQLLKGRDAIITGGMFGSKSNLSIPVKSSDFVYPFLILKCGLIVGIITVMIYLVLFFSTSKVAEKCSDPVKKVICTFASLSIFVQALITIFGSTNYTVMTGVPLPLISSGGSAYLISSIFITILFYESLKKHYTFKKIENFVPRNKKEEKKEFCLSINE